VSRVAEPALGLDPGLIRRFAAALDEFGYDHLLRAVRGSYPLTPFPPYVEFRQRSRALSAAERSWFDLLLLGRPLPRNAVEDALGSELTANLLSLGVLRTAGGRLATASLGLTSFDGTYALASLPRLYPTCSDRRRRAYIGQESYLLAHFLPAPRSASALDLCSGSGFLALQLAGRADRVVAVDIDPISVEVGRFNSLLNGLEPTIDTRQGDLWQPVAEERFDVIVFNAPWVVTPAGLPSATFRDGGPDGLRLLGPIFDGLATHLGRRGSAVCYLEAFGDERQPHLLRRLEELAVRDRLAIDVLLLFRFPIAEFLAEAGKSDAQGPALYRRLVKEHDARRYYKLIVRFRSGNPGVRYRDAGRFV
jgi:methylase of polypeptide subunit release factors